MGGKEALKCLMELDPTVNGSFRADMRPTPTIEPVSGFGFRGVIAKPYETRQNSGGRDYDIIQSSRVNLAVAFEEGRLASRVA